MAAIFQRFRRQAVKKSQKPSAKHTFEGHHSIQSFVFLQDNVHIVSGSDDGTIRKWDCRTGQPVGEPWEGEARVSTLVLSPDGKTIACGRHNGSVEQWDTNGQMKEDIWTGHNDWVRSLSWSPSGGHLASASDDGTILVRRVENGAVDVGPIKANQGWVRCVAYSPLGDRIASGGNDESICIWDSHTGKLLVGPINRLGTSVTSVVWSNDGSKLYSASDQFARAFDSTSGVLLHHFEHVNYLYSVALSPENNLLACVGYGTTTAAQLWDTRSHQSFPQLVNHEAQASDTVALRHVSFSPDGRYLAYGGADRKITLWMVEDITVNEPLVASSSTSLRGDTHQRILPKLQSSSSLNVGDTNLLEQFVTNDDQGYTNLYRSFFTPSPPSSSPNSISKRRSRRAISVLHRPTHIFLRHMYRTSSQPPADCEPPKPGMKGKSRAVNQDDEQDDIDSSEDVVPGSTEQSNDKDKQLQDPISDGQFTTPGNISSPAELDTNENRVLWKTLFHSRRNDINNVPVNITQDSSTRVVDVFPLRHHKGFVAHKRKYKKKSVHTTTGAQTIPAPTGGPSSSQPGLLGHSTHPPMLLQGQADQYLQTNDDSYTDSNSCSDSSIGPFLKCLDKLCFPCGHYKD